MNNYSNFSSSLNEIGTQNEKRKESYTTDIERICKYNQIQFIDIDSTVISEYCFDQYFTTDNVIKLIRVVLYYLDNEKYKTNDIGIRKHINSKIDNIITYLESLYKYNNATKFNKN